MLQKHIIKFGLPLLMLFTAGCGSSKKSGKSAVQMPGTWQAQPIVIDGDCKDWPSPYPNYDSKAKVAYATSNDEHNLYITMQTGDEETQMKILKQGMIVSIDTNGKRDKEASIHINYPLPNDNDYGDVTKRESHGSSLMSKKWEKTLHILAKDANQYSLEGFKSCNGGYVITQTTPCGIKILMKIDEYKELVWEAVIPFKAIYNKDIITAADAGRPISVCFAVNRFKQPSTKGENSAGMTNSMNANSMNPASSPTAGRAGARTGSRGMSGDPTQYLYEATKTWKQFGLAWQK